MNILILFSGIGGATKGIKDIYPDATYTSVDIDPLTHPDICKDVFELDPEWLKSFDFIWASPPCQGYSIAGKAQKTLLGKEYPKLLDQTIELLERVGKPYCIENVVGAKSSLKKHSVILYGYNFPNLRDMRRPRKFWASYSIPKPPKFEKIFPSKRLISGGGGWIREGEKVERMSLDEAKKRFGFENTDVTMQQIAQIVLPEYSKYCISFFKESTK